MPNPSSLDWLTRLRRGLRKSAGRITEGIGALFTRRCLDEATLEELEELLITADLGVEVAAELTGELARTRFGKEVTEEEVREAFAAHIAQMLDPVAVPFVPEEGRRPHIVLVVGVNGNGKTTTIGKLAHHLTQEGKRVMLAAGDTFRAAAVEQLGIWGERTGCPVVKAEIGADPASVAYAAVEQARAAGVDVLLIDTAGRLQNQQNLMQELEKIIRVIRKHDDTAPHSILQVLDATTGQNAHRQVEVFREIAGVTGLVITKLDGTAKGGVVVALAKRFGLPLHAIGVGEGIDDLRPFTARDFARNVMGLE